MINDLGCFLEYAENVTISSEIANYRPHRRPITKVPSAKESRKFKQKRKLVARDWFFFAIWASRLKKVLDMAPRLLEDRERRLVEFQKNSCRLSSMLAVERKKCKSNQERLETDEDVDSGTHDTYMAKMKLKIGAEIARIREERRKAAEKYWGIHVTLRMQELSTRLFCSGQRSAGGPPCVEVRIIV